MSPSAQNELARADVRRRDGYRCTDCGITQGEYSRRLNLNHLERWLETFRIYGWEFKQEYSMIFRLDVHRIDPEGPYTLENCRTLCRKCHSQHRRDFLAEAFIQAGKIRQLQIA